MGHCPMDKPSVPPFVSPPSSRHRDLPAPLGRSTAVLRRVFGAHAGALRLLEAILMVGRPLISCGR